MVNVMCSGQQNRQTTTSETHPNRPPPKTRNCYRTGDFKWNQCGTSNDGACKEYGGTQSCKPDNSGGYCQVGNQYFVSNGPSWTELSVKELLERYDSGTGETSREVRRALNDQERRFTNRIRELQIMGKDPLIQRTDKKEGKEDMHSFVDMLFNVGIGISVVIFLISICIILIQNKII
jgi:hypothetical protein